MEWLNVLRPTVAASVYISVYMVFCAHALHQFPASAEALRTGGQPYMDAFISEVRRYYPFSPAVPPGSANRFGWGGHDFPRNRRVMLDLYGTNHDERAWPDAETFQPRRFLQRNGDAAESPTGEDAVESPTRGDAAESPVGEDAAESPVGEDAAESPAGDDAYAFVPQGGGSHEFQHRCPGEWITAALMRTAIEFFTHEIRYNIPAQDLRVDATRLPALPRSRFVMNEIRSEIRARADATEHA